MCPSQPPPRPTGTSFFLIVSSEIQLDEEDQNVHADMDRCPAYASCISYYTNIVWRLGGTFQTSQLTTSRNQFGVLSHLIQTYLTDIDGESESHDLTSDEGAEQFRPLMSFVVSQLDLV